MESGRRSPVDRGDVPPDKVLRIGGLSNGARSTDASIIDLGGATPTVTPTGSMTSARAWADSTVLPDGKVLVTGGSREDNQLVDVAFAPELWDPATGSWTQMAAGRQERLYHSVSILLPDGAVLLAGGGEPGPVVNDDAEIFYPPYLFQADGSPAPRPSWISAPTSLPYSGQATGTVKPGDIISQVTLIKTGSVTHSYDMEQRFMELPFTQNGNTLTVQGPPSANVATPGHYLLFAVDQNGVPSAAAGVRIGASILNAAPVGAASGTPAVGTAPIQVSFSGVGSSDPDGDPLTYSWDFGDGNGSTRPNPTHTYAFGGAYVATLTVRDDKGWWGSAQVRLEIEGPPPPPPQPPDPSRGVPAAGPPGPAPAPPTAPAAASRSPALRV
ncbi:MAG: DUF1929 domain-containing protein, partial [Thermoleophilia bacterium]|nr:DUF1929 domain-containing protein [Thermoleophilia bacterium]